MPVLKYKLASGWKTIYGALLNMMVRKDKNLSDLENIAKARQNLELTGNNNATHYHDSRYIPRIESVETQVAQYEGSIDSLEDEISQCANDIDVLDARITRNASSISSLQTTVAGHTTSISSLNSGLTTCQNDIRSVNTKATNNASAITTLSNDVNTRFNAVNASLSDVLKKGMIMDWYGASNKVPAGWHICDGSTVNGIQIPDLRNKFVLSAGGTYPTGSSGQFTIPAAVTVVTWSGTSGETMPTTVSGTAPTQNATTLPSYYALFKIIYVGE